MALEKVSKIAKQSLGLQARARISGRQGNLCLFQHCLFAISNTGIFRKNFPGRLLLLKSCFVM